MNKLELKDACCMYVKYEEPDFEDFDLMVFGVMELDNTIIEPMDVTDGDLEGIKLSVSSEIVYL